MPIVSPPQSTILLHSSPAAKTMLCHHAYHHHQKQQQQEQEAMTESIRKLSQLHEDQLNKDNTVPDTVSRYHTHSVSSTQCSSAVIQQIAAPISTVWSFLRRFDNPQAYKHFLKSCHLLTKDTKSVGALREVHVISGLPASTSTERLDILDDERHVIGFSVVCGEHRLSNYRSVTTAHSSGTGMTVVVESYEVDVPAGNTKEETCIFVDTIVRCNLQSLARIAQSKAAAAAATARGFSLI
ncbi:unnamed protein product [Rhodiola kirilowii]